MTEPSTTLPLRAVDVFEDRLAELSDEFTSIARERSALDAREARLLARSAALADAMADSLVSHDETPAQRKALVRRSACAALAMATRSSEQTVQRATGDAERLVADAPAVLSALEDGRISGRHARTITDQLRDIPAHGRAAFVKRILPIAEQSTVARLQQRARVLRERVHPESITVRAARSEADRRVEVEPAADGMAWVHLFTTAPVAIAIGERLDALVGAAHLTNDDRTCQQLRADALGSLCISGVTTSDQTDHQGRRSPIARPVEVLDDIQPTVNLTVPVLSLLGVTETPATLDGYGPIDPETAARLAVNAPSMTRVLTDPETSSVLSVGRQQYRVPADLQRAVRLRDVTCRAPGCGRRARACDLDHSIAWADGGTTSVGNLACVCRHHHRLKHLPGWSLDHRADGVLDWTTPDGKRHRTEPDADPPF
ncbi:HNH endonuclease signature motif containing protein [Plantibacter sp. LMC-P-059a]|uniref:HNH endonuclease signature motif containing protein n=1 Tax=Plantibacter sp. LMC-P-059a TaxID=3040297 RepID=UPI00254DA593|nr:HNH endonuclease signature motif containing protein [Plantibacter sp. LMC-P-059a]